MPHHTAPDCPFCRIAAGTLPAFIVHESEHLLAFLDIAPIRPGHIQLIPKEHHISFDVMPPDLLAGIATTGQKIAQALRRLYEVDRVGFAFLGTDVPHVHAHLVPLVRPDDLTSRQFIVEENITFRRPACPPREEMEQVASEVRLALG